MARIAILAMVGILLILPAPVIGAEGQPQPDPHVERGRALANRICWACHVVGADQEFSPILRSPGPDFRVIAKRQAVTAESLTTFLRSTHQTESKPYTMPNPRLTEEMINEVVNYIMSLRNGR